MNNEWLNNLRSRMENHEEEVPEGLWDDIRDELFSEEEENNCIAGSIPSIDAENKGKKAEDRKDRTQSWLYRIGGAAAAAVLVFIMMKTGTEESREKLAQNHSGSAEKTGINLPLNNAGQEDSTRIKRKTKVGIPLAQNHFNAGYSYIRSAEYSKPENTGIKETETRKNNQVIVKAPQRVEPIAVDKEDKPKETPLADGKINKEEFEKEINKVKNEWPEQYADHKGTKNVKSRSEKKWMLSMLTGNASSNSAEQQFHGYASVNGAPLNFEQVWSASEYVEDPLTQILLANQSKPVEARIRHKIPVTFGLSVYYSLGKRWGIGTGINYTKLASELHSGSADNYIKGDQTVHYIGIPVQVNYNVIQKGRFTGYITGGAMLEKPISGSVTTSYVVHDEVRETSKENIDHKPLSFSVNTAAGIQVKVIDRLGIYAEPGVGYHFRDEGSPNTIYKEKPLHFNVKFGIRLLID